MRVPLIDRKGGAHLYSPAHRESEAQDNTRSRAVRATEQDPVAKRQAGEIVQCGKVLSAKPDNHHANL